MSYVWGMYWDYKHDFRGSGRTRIIVSSPSYRSVGWRKIRNDFRNSVISDPLDKTETTSADGEQSTASYDR
jgi:hypothetical protein